MANFVGFMGRGTGAAEEPAGASGTSFGASGMLSLRAGTTGWELVVASWTSGVAGHKANSLPEAVSEKAEEESGDIPDKQD